MNKLTNYLKRNNINYDIKNAHDSNGLIIFISVKELNSKVKNYIIKRYDWRYRGDFEYIGIYLN